MKIIKIANYLINKYSQLPPGESVTRQEAFRAAEFFLRDVTVYQKSDNAINVLEAIRDGKQESLSKEEKQNFKKEFKESKDFRYFDQNKYFNVLKALDSNVT